ncbi:MAG: nitroreductase family protein [Actinobacteria bacterium]|jgi:nitroreductase|nr:nitroreductase family protein [Actinomycetes bacterium]MCX6506966.1 nitroreductase family protein [Actinomycetota bacterium]
MDIREALYTTRAMRRVKPDPIPMDVQARIMDAAVRAPSGGNTQNWRFLLVDDPEVKAKLGPIYRQAMSVLWGSYYKDRIDAAHDAPELEESKSMLRVQKSAQWLADNFEMVPLYMFGFAQHDPSGSSVYPALWNAQLAARAEGVGTSLTQVLVFHNDEVLDILGVPKDEGWNMLGCVSLGYPTGKWGVATRQPAHDVSFRNQWGDDVGFRDDEPLWP